MLFVIVLVTYCANRNGLALETSNRRVDATQSSANLIYDTLLVVHISIQFHRSHDGAQGLFDSRHRSAYFFFSSLEDKGFREVTTIFSYRINFENVVGEARSICARRAGETRARGGKLPGPAVERGRQFRKSVCIPNAFCVFTRAGGAVWFIFATWERHGTGSLTGLPAHSGRNRRADEPGTQIKKQQQLSPRREAARQRGVCGENRSWGKRMNATRECLCKRRHEPALV